MTMKLPDRQVMITKAVRKAVPLSVAVVGPSSGGKTYTALRLGTGMRQAMGGKLFLIDTESNRALHYADQFDFYHVPMGAPFSPLDYLAVIQACYESCNGEPCTIVIDSISHSWEGPGGVLEMQEAEIERMAGSDNRKRMSMAPLSWNKPKRQSQRFINTILQLPVNFILCFRAKEKIEFKKGSDPTRLGWMPIGDKGYIFEFAASILLPPNSEGVPNWDPADTGERMWVKRPKWARGILADGAQINEDMGRALATWSLGDKPPSVTDLLMDLATCQLPSELGSLGRTLKAHAPSFSDEDQSKLRAAYKDATARFKAKDEAEEARLEAERAEQETRRLADESADAQAGQ